MSTDATIIGGEHKSAPAIGGTNAATVTGGSHGSPVVAGDVKGNTHVSTPVNAPVKTATPHAASPIVDNSAHTVAPGAVNKTDHTATTVKGAVHPVASPSATTGESKNVVTNTIITPPAATAAAVAAEGRDIKFIKEDLAKLNELGTRLMGDVGKLEEHHNKAAGGSAVAKCETNIIMPSKPTEHLSGVKEVLKSAPNHHLGA